MGEHGYFVGTDLLTADTLVKQSRTSVQTVVTVGGGNVGLYDWYTVPDNGWSVYSGATYQATMTVETLICFMDTTRLTKGGSKDTLLDHEWFWLSNVLYVRDDTGSPLLIRSAFVRQMLPIGHASVASVHNWPELLHFQEALYCDVTGTCSFCLSYN